MSDLVMTGATADEVWPLVRDFHYSKRNAGLIHHAFAWREPGGLFGETGEPLAAISYSQPVSRNHPQTALELSRLVRKEGFTKPLSQFVAWSLRWLRANTETPFVLSYADSTQGHHGGIYQACNFHYVGETTAGHIGYNCPDGTFVHRRNCNTRFGVGGAEEMARIKPDWEPVFGMPKHLYIFPLRKKWKALVVDHGFVAQPFPKPDKNLNPDCGMC